MAGYEYVTLDGSGNIVNTNVDLSNVPLTTETEGKTVKTASGREGMTVWKQSDGTYLGEKAAREEARKRVVDMFSIGLNKDSGNVQITAPKEFLDSPYWKGDDEIGLPSYKNIFNELSQAYKLNDEYAFEMEFNGEKQTKTAEDWINTIGEKLKKTVVPNYVETLKNREEAEDPYINDFSDSQYFLYMQKFGPQSGDSERAIVPVFWGKKYLNDIEDYDENTSTISKKEFRDKFYNRDVVEDDVIVDSYYELERYITQTKRDIDLAETEEEKNALRKDLASALAWKETLSAESPQVGFLEGLGDIVSSAVGALTNQSAKTTGETIRGVNDLVTWALDSTLYSGMTQEEKEKAGWNDNAINEVTTTTIDFAEEKYKEGIDRLKVLNQNVQGVYSLSGLVGSLGTTIIVSMLASKATANAIKNTLSSLFNAVGDVTTRVGVTAASLPTAAEGVTDVANYGDALIQGAYLIEKLSTSEQLASVMNTALKIGQWSYNMSSVIASGASGIATLPSASRHAINATLRVADILSDAFVGAALSDSNTFHRIMTQTSLPEESKAYLMSQAIQSGVGFAVSTSAMKSAGVLSYGVKKTTKAVAATKFGKAIDSVTAPRMAVARGFVIKISNNLDKIFRKSGDDFVKKFQNAEQLKSNYSAGSRKFKKASAEAEKAYYGLQRRVERDLIESANQKLIDAKGKGVKAVQEAKAAVAKAENAIDDIQRGVEEKFALFYSEANPEYADANKDVIKTYTELSELTSDESIYGKRGASLSTDELGVSESGISQISQKTTNYVVAKADSRILLDNIAVDFYGAENFSKVVFDFSPNATHVDGQLIITLEDIRAKYSNGGKYKQLSTDLYMMKTFTDVASSEALTKADELTDKLRRAYALRNGVLEYGINGSGSISGIGYGGLINAEQLDELHNSMRFGADGKDYMYVRRVQEVKQPTGKFVTSDLSYAPREFYDRSWGATRDFEDPLVTFIERQNEDAYRMSLNDFMQVQKETVPGIFDNILISPKQSNLARIAKLDKEGRTKNIFTRAFSDIKAGKTDRAKNFKNLVGDGIFEDGGTNINKVMFGRDVDDKLKAAEKRFQTAQNQVADYSKVKITDTDKTVYVQHMSNADREALIAERGIKPKPHKELDDKLGKLQALRDTARKDGEDLQEINTKIRDLRREIRTFEKNSINEQLAATDYVKTETKLSKALDNLAEAQTIYNKEIESISNLLDTPDLNTGNVINTVNEAVDQIVENIDSSGDKLVRRTFKAAYGNESEEIQEAVARHHLYQEMLDKWDTKYTDAAGGYHTFKSDIQDSIANELKDRVAARRNALAKDGTEFLESEVKKMDKTCEKLAAEYTDMIYNNLETRVGQNLTELQALGFDTTTISSSIHKTLSDLVDDVTKAGKASNIIGMHDGSIVSVDPVIATFYNYHPSTVGDNWFNTLRKLEAAIFRVGTTGINPASILNQYCKDPISAFVQGGTRRSMNQMADAIAEEFGEEVADSIRKFEPKVYDWYKARYTDARELQRELITREMDLGELMNPNNREYKLYEFLQQNKAERLYEQGVTRQTKVDGAFETAKKRFNQVFEILEKPNDVREDFLRRAGYANGMYDALSSGYTLDQARTFGKFVMNNATTNFSRKLVHLHNFFDSVPYFRSAVNGTKSFWRMVALDPIGVFYRMSVGLVLPVIALTGSNLSDKKNREAYKNLREYQRDGNLVIMNNGQALTIPLPEQLSAFISPWRQWVESLHDSNTDSFWKLMLNNAVGMLPVDLTGFVNADPSNLLANDFWSRHIVPGFSRAASQMLSPFEKSLVMLQTGYDPYTNKPVYEGYKYYDPLTGEAQIMDYTSGEFSQFVASLFGGWTSPAMAQKVLESLLGVANVGVINGFLALGDGMGGITQNIKGIGETLQKPFTEGVYDRATQEFKQAVSILTSKKESLLHDKDIQAYLSVLSDSSKSDADKKNAQAKVKDKINEFYEEILDMTDNYKKKFNVTLSKTQFASLLQLTNLETGGETRSLLNAVSDYAASIDQDQYYQGENIAVQTMQEMGFTGTQDMSIFGYYKKKADGTVSIEYSQPLAMLAYESVERSQGDLAEFNINNLIKQNNLNNAKNTEREQEDKIWNDNSMSSKQKKAAIDAIRVNWNSKVMSTIAPYVNEVGPENAINNTKVINILRQYIKVPYSAMGYVSNKDALVQGSANEAYVKNYIKYIFEVNDTGWEGGAGDFSK